MVLVGGFIMTLLQLLMRLSILVMYRRYQEPSCEETTFIRFDVGRLSDLDISLEHSVQGVKG